MTAQATAPITIVSTPVLTRVGGLPCDVLDIAGPAARGLLAELAAGEERLRELAPGLIDMCFALVPRLDDDVPLRRRVLSGKRALNKLAPLPWDEEVRARLAARVTAEDAAGVEDWVRLTDARAELTLKLGDQLAADRAAAVEGLRRALASPGFAESVALAAPDWIRHGRRRAGSARDLKTLYSYVSRAAVKTSPFSGLTTVGVAGEQGLGRARSRASATLAHQALQRLARDERTAALLRYRPAPVRPGGPDEPSGLLLHAEVMIAGGVIWRHDRVVEADHALPWVAGLPAPLTLGELLARIGGERPFARFRRLLDTGLVHPMPPWDRAEDPLPALAVLAEGGPIPAGDLRRAHELGATAHRMDVGGRIEAAAGIQRVTSGWAEQRDEGERGPSGLIYEDRETDLRLPDPCAVPEVRADLESLGARIRPYVFRSHVYDLLVERFRAEFGPGGACRDPLGFLMRLTVDRDSNPPLDAASAADLAARAAPGERAWLPVGPTSAPPSAGLLFQLEAAGYDEVAAGRYRLVLNHFSSGGGGLFTRFGALLGDDFRRRLAAHVVRSRGGVRCRELVVWTDCNTVQAECAGLLPPLLLPGELGAASGITLDDTVLAHDPADDTLSLFDRQGDPIGLAYLGLIPQHLQQSYVRLLAALADPWVNASPDSDYTLTKAHELAPLCGGDVVEVPRVAEGRVVTRRASWVVPVGAIPAPGDDGDARFAVRLDAFRRAHGMPEEVFVHQLGGMGFGGTGDRKPMWVSLASPLSAGVLAQWLSPATTHVRMVEALPERHLQPQLDAQGRRRVTEHAALLYWPKDGSA
ncbi:hypothetical protein DQ384_14675 [Sphaerisporangium album]|uniref:Lantibiotic dehydratase N-terminal domain-containing protein n=1 Tax=Sphaerisporangium album TaxID=509200 RepID=A0A367FJH1_9ACTN|nr:lantibiotic dehydratase [Sphaerisporangium album]RCG30548.1 hypothetical protein DQ384_14675 [Sphaerisporangium album]